MKCTTRILPALLIPKEGHTSTNLKSTPVASLDLFQKQNKNRGILGSLEPNVSRVWLEVKTLNVHSVCDELLKPLTPSSFSTWVNEHKSFCYGITRINSWAILINWTKYTKLTCNYPRREKILKETWICEYWLWFFHPLFSHTLPKPKDPWQRFLASIQMLWATHWTIQTRSLPHPELLPVQFLRAFLQLRPPSSFISLQHRPLISPNPNQIMELAIF